MPAIMKSMMQWRLKIPVRGATVSGKPRSSAFRRHPLATTPAVTIQMEYDEDASAFVVYVSELHRMSTFRATEWEALDNTAEMIRGYLKSIAAHRKRIPLSAAKLKALQHVAGIA